MLSDPLLSAILAKLSEIHEDLEKIYRTLESDRANLWKILALTIAGSFALVGIKLVFP